MKASLQGGDNATGTTATRAATSSTTRKAFDRGIPIPTPRSQGNPRGDIETAENDPAVTERLLVEEREARQMSEAETQRLRKLLADKKTEDELQKLAAAMERKAQSRLGIAKLLLKDGKTGAAREILQEVVKKYPDTKAAKESRDLL
jgi:hypothetical protein